jgi:hypothetical protein
MQLQHHYGVLTVKPEFVAEVQEMMMRCEDQIQRMQDTGGPLNWCCSLDETIEMLAAPPETVIREVFAKTSTAAA